MKHLLLLACLVAASGCSSPSASIQENAPDPTLAKELTELRTRLADMPRISSGASVEAAALQTKAFAEQGALIQRGAGSTDSVCQHAAASLASRLAATQAHTFPVLRRAYVNSLAKQAKQANIRVEAVGNQCLGVRFISSKFSNAQSITTFKATHWNPLVALRFHHALFQWNKGDGEATIDTGAMLDRQVSDRVSGQ